MSIKVNERKFNTSSRELGARVEFWHRYFTRKKIYGSWSMASLRICVLALWAFLVPRSVRSNCKCLCVHATVSIKVNERKFNTSSLELGARVEFWHRYMYFTRKRSMVLLLCVSVCSPYERFWSRDLYGPIVSVCVYVSVHVYIYIYIYI